MQPEIGARIKEARLKAGLTLKELGKIIGIAESNMQKHEAGTIKRLSTIRLYELAAALNVTPEWIMGWEEKEVDKRTINSSDLTTEEIEKVNEYIAFLKSQRK